MATAPRQPQDHKQKASDEEREERFTYEVDGETFTMPHATIDVLTPGWYRRNRGQSAQDFLLTCLERVSEGKDQGRLLAFLDRPGREAKDDTTRILNAFEEHVGATVGE